MMMHTLLITLVIGDQTGTTVVKDQVEFMNKKTCAVAVNFVTGRSNRVENVYRAARAGLKPVYIFDAYCVPYALPEPKESKPVQYLTPQAEEIK